VFGSILHRTILAELARVFALSLVGITGILVMAGVVAEASQQGLSPAQVLAVIPLLVPSTLPYTIPATTLFATSVVYGRLANDNEVLAIKAAGINVMKVVVWPGVLLGIVMSTATMALYYRLIPYTHYLLRTQFLNEVEESCYTLLKKDRCIKQPGLNYCMWVRQVQGKRLLEALFKRRDPKTGHYDVIARAREAELRYDATNKQLLVHMHHCQLLGENGGGRGYLQEKTWPVPLGDSLAIPMAPKPRAMSYPELFEYLHKMQQEVEARAAEIALTVTRLQLTQPPLDLPRHLENLKSAQRQYQQEIYSVQTELCLRPALSFGCLCFVLVGCPVGIWFSRSDYLSAFISCFLPIVFIYYPLVLCGTNLAKQGRFNPVLDLWTANGLMVIIAAELFRRLLKH
jgi:lipopolysaccharide export system permease protein